MNPKLTFQWWKPIVVVFGILPVISFIITEWSYRHNVRHMISYVMRIGFVSFVALVIGGIVLIRRGESKWGLIALGFAFFTFFVYFIMIPAGIGK
jgi:hypothetical protein